MIGNKKKTYVVTFKLDEDLYRELELYSHNSKMYRSDVIRKALKEYLKDKKINRVTSTF